MQMPVYLFAAADILSPSFPALPAAAVYLSIRTDDSPRTVFKAEDRSEYQRFRGAFATVFFETVDRIRSGDFGVTADNDCPPSCIGRGICRLSESRMEALAVPQ